MTSALYSENLEKIRKDLPRLALKLDGAGASPFPPPRDSLEEAESHFKTLSINGIGVVFCFGLGQGYFYTAAKKWLKEDEDRYLIFVEDKPHVFAHFLQEEISSEILGNDQVRLCYFEDIGKDNLSFRRLCFLYPDLKAITTALPEYREKRESDFTRISDSINQHSLGAGVLVEENLDYGASFFRNFYGNLASLPRVSKGSGLEGEFTNIPAIIVGAGPSLNKNIHLLKKLQNRALIFGGGSSLNAMSAHEITPHFSAGIDPNWSQYKRQLSSNSFEVPFFYYPRMFYPALDLIHGPKVYLNGAGGDTTAQWFDEELGIEGHGFITGHNVLNTCVSIASVLGCDPIIFVGLDLAFTDDKNYADGIVNHSAPKQKGKPPTLRPYLVSDKQGTPVHSIDTSTVEMGFLSWEEIQEAGANEHFDDMNFKRIDFTSVDGKPVVTLQKWITEASWMGHFALDNPATTFYNATEGGLGVPGVENISLKQVADRFLIREFDMQSRVHHAVENAKISGVNKSEVDSLVDEFRESLERCTGFYAELIEACEKAQAILNEKKLGGLLPTMEITLSEADLSVEVAYQYFSKPFEDNFAKTQERKLLKIEEGSLARLPGWEKDLKKLDLDIERYSFVRKAIESNLKLIKTFY